MSGVLEEEKKNHGVVKEVMKVEFGNESWEEKRLSSHMETGKKTHANV